MLGTLALPFLAWGALEGGAWMARSIPRITFALVVGATGAAFLASGGPSIYYPHLPEAFTRPVPKLVRWLVRENPVPPGSVLLTGTGLVPPDDVALAPGYAVEVEIPGIGTLRNPVVAASELGGTNGS